MRRGGPIFLILGLVFVVLIGALAFFALSPGVLASLGLGPQVAATATIPVVKVVVAAQLIPKDQEITDELLTTIDLPQNFWKENMLTEKQAVIGKFAAIEISPGWFLSESMVLQHPHTGGSKVILPGQVAITIPAKRLDMVGYAIKDGDYVDVIATTMFVDLDASFQSELPNSFGQVVNIGTQPEAAPLAVLGMNNGSSQPRAAGRAELDPTLNQVIYLVPSEMQRPRLVSQIILQDIQVLHVGNFSVDSADAQPTPDATQGSQSGPTAVPVAASEPDIITLIVSPQDAVSLTYLQYSGTKLTFSLRAPDDRSRAETEAATLQYILSQYAIPVPAKLPYGMESSLPVFDIKATATPRP
jgi:Flp pilus assembly protein CpaB